MPLELARSIQLSRQAELRTRLDALFAGWPSEFTLEIGCGHGHFLAAYAAAHPAEHCLGVDLVLDRIERAERKARRAGSPNVAFIQTEARMLLETLPPTCRVGRVFVLFPDPWPKRRHHKNRLINAAFLDLLAARAAPEARLYFRTDFEPYFAEAREALACHATWQLTEEPWKFEEPTVFQSRAASFQSCVARLRPNP